jgi:hypothetical protein
MVPMGVLIHPRLKGCPLEMDCIHLFVFKFKVSSNSYFIHFFIDIRVIRKVVPY